MSRKSLVVVLLTWYSTNRTVSIFLGAHPGLIFIFGQEEALLGRIWENQGSPHFLEANFLLFELSSLGPPVRRGNLDIWCKSREYGVP